MPAAAAIPDSFLTPWQHALTTAPTDDRAFPTYPDPSALVTSCRPHSLTTGTGLSVFSTTLVPALRCARHEILLVTCFLARSPSLTALSDALTQLAAERAAAHPDGSARPLRVRIGFSSSSPLQKLLHTASRAGKLYPPAAWPGLGLPAREVLAAGNIELAVKSLFFTPLSVMHPKFLVVDRARAWMPSCNVSWEPWFEGCLGFEGPAVERLLDFYSRVWVAGDDDTFALPELALGQPEQEEKPVAASASGNDGTDTALLPHRHIQLLLLPQACCVPAILLPSSHHRNPRFRPFSRRAAPPPPTPLNAALLTLFGIAQRDICITTPNLTCAVVVDALVDALARGVNVHITTSRDMMVVEQLVTAGTTTARCLRGLVERYEAGVLLRPEAKYSWAWWRARLWPFSAPQAEPLAAGAAEEEARPAPGQLCIRYYRARDDGEEAGVQQEPVVSHFKLTVVDGEYFVFGSGNMDRASWYTSQELGLLVYAVPGGVLERQAWEGPLASRTEAYYPASE